MYQKWPKQRDSNGRPDEFLFSLIIFLTWLKPFWKGGAARVWHGLHCRNVLWPSWTSWSRPAAPWWTCRGWQRCRKRTCRPASNAWTGLQPNTEKNVPINNMFWRSLVSVISAFSKLFCARQRIDNSLVFDSRFFYSPFNYNTLPGKLVPEWPRELASRWFRRWKGRCRWHRHTTAWKCRRSPWGSSPSSGRRSRLCPIRSEHGRQHILWNEKEMFRNNVGFQFTLNCWSSDNR